MKYKNETLNEREKTHGSFGGNAHVAQGIKALMQSSPGWTRMSYAQREAVELIATKLGRLSAGNPAEADHWKDIAGYATLGELWGAKASGPAPKA